MCLYVYSTSTSRQCSCKICGLIMSIFRKYELKLRSALVPKSEYSFSVKTCRNLVYYLSRRHLFLRWSFLLALIFSSCSPEDWYIFVCAGLPLLPIICTDPLLLATAAILLRTRSTSHLLVDKLWDFTQKNLPSFLWMLLNSATIRSKNNWNVDESWLKSVYLLKGNSHIYSIDTLLHLTMVSV